MKLFIMAMGSDSAVIYMQISSFLAELKSDCIAIVVFPVPAVPAINTMEGLRKPPSSTLSRPFTPDVTCFIHAHCIISDYNKLSIFFLKSAIKQASPYDIFYLIGCLCHLN